MRRRNAPAVTPYTMQGYKAGFVTRLLAFVLDILIVSGLTLTVTTITTIILNFLGFESWVSIASSTGDTVGLVSVLFLVLVVGGLNVIIFVGYPVIFWVLAGQTLGKRLMGLRVISVQGGPIILKQALIRFVGYWLSALPLFLGYWWVLIDDDRQSWHDKFAKTYVVYDWDARHNEDFIRLLQQRAAQRAERNRLVKTSRSDRQTENVLPPRVDD